MTGIDRIKNAFNKNSPAFMPYSVLGYPTRQASLTIVQTLADVGADLLELGIPFSIRWPMAQRFRPPPRNR